MDFFTISLSQANAILDILLFRMATVKSFVIAILAASTIAVVPSSPGSLTALKDVLPPDPEPIEVTELPLPPVAPSTAEGSCSPDINPSGTGCILQTGGLVQSGSFLPDGTHVTALVNFTGAAAAPDPASVYTGSQIILVKSDGTTFPNGDAWKCVTCGMPEENAQGVNEDMSYPQAFRDGKRILTGPNIIDCGDHDLASEECTPEETHMYPIRWNTTPDGSGAGGTIRELRLHPDNVHIGFNSFTMTGEQLGQVGYLSRLEFNPSPTTGTPSVPRFDLVNVTSLFNEAVEYQPLIVEEDNQIRINPDMISVGELRGFSGTGKEVTYVGYPAESSNIDVFAADLTTGKVSRLTSHPEYCDPVDISSDDEWIAIMDTRGSGRQMFMAGMRGVPPLTDIVSTSATSSTRNNGQRRFFQPYVLDRYGDRGDYYGQKVNAAGDGTPGSVNDPQWNGMADPRWSLDVTRLAYWQALTIAPACGGENPLPCPSSTEPGGRTERLMVAHFTDRTPVDWKTIEPISDTVPWGTPYVAGSTPPPRTFLPGGAYTLNGAASGSAAVVITENSDQTAVRSVAVTYENFSDDGLTWLDGFENVTVNNPSVTLNEVDWYSNLTQTGEANASKKTSPDGFHLSIDVLTNIFQANGTLTTTIDGVVYEQPANGT